MPNTTRPLLSLLLTLLLLGGCGKEEAQVGDSEFVRTVSAPAGGTDMQDGRFMELPLVEPRKTMEEVPTRKRAVYRRRFAMLDEIDQEVAERIQAILR